MATIDDLQQALVNADKAGDSQAAQALADHIRSVQALPNNSRFPQWLQTGAGAIQSNRIASGVDTVALGMAKPFLGANELFDKAAGGAGQYLTSVGGRYPNPVSNWLGNAAKSGGQLTDMLTRDRNAMIQASGQGPMATAILDLAGNVGSPMNTLMPSSTGLTGDMGTGAAFGAMQPTGERGTPAQALLNTAAGAVGGGAGYGLGRLGGRGGRTTARQAAVDLLRSEGVEPPIGAAIGGGVRTLEQKGESFPFIGGAIRKSEIRANEELNQAVYNRVLAPIGETLPSGIAPGRDAIQMVNAKVHRAYDAALSGVAVPKNERLDQDIQAVMANASTLHPDRLTQLGAWVQRIEQKFASNRGVLDGEALKNLSSDIRKGAQNLLHGADSEARDLGMSVDQLDEALLQAARRFNPDIGPALNAADQAYTGLIRLNRAAGYNGAAGTGGVFTPANLVSAVSATARGKAAKAMGTAPMQDLSDAAAMVLKPTLPNSGTADRILTPALMAGSAAMHNPAMAAGMGGTWLGSRALYSRPVTSAVNSLTRSQAMAQLAQLLQSSGIAGRLPPALLQQLQTGGTGFPVGFQAP